MYFCLLCKISDNFIHFHHLLSIKASLYQGTYQFAAAVRMEKGQPVKTFFE